jgi:chaperonin GroEL
VGHQQLTLSELSQRTRRIQVGDPAHSAFQRGVTQIVEAVRPTLGPLPRTVAIDRPAKGMTPELLDSGAAIARRITQIANPHDDPGAMYLRGLLWRIHEEVGDGTTTAAVIFDAVYRKGRRAIASGVSAQRLRIHLDRAADVLAAAIDAQARPIRDSKTIEGLSRSATHDRELADLVSEVVDITGAHGQVDLRDAHGAASRYELVEGTFWESGVLSDAFIDVTPRQRIGLIDAPVLLTDLDLNDPTPLIPVLEHAIATEARGLLIIARSITPPVTAFLLANGRANNLPVAVVKTPGLGTAEQQSIVDDLAVITGAQPLRSATGDQLRSLTGDHLGRIRRGWANKRQFGIVGGNGDAIVLRHHVRALINQLDNTPKRADRTPILARLGKFQRGSATIYIGGATESEQKFNRKSAERTIEVLRRSLSSGTVSGGGASLLHCKSAIERHFSGECLEERWVRQIVGRALEAPTRTIAENSGFEASTIIARVQSGDTSLGFDVLTGLIFDMHNAGIVDPVFVVREAATRAIRSAALALTIDVIVHRHQTDISTSPE